MESIWKSFVKIEPRPPFPGGQIKTDVLIIGGGLAGVLCAYKLKKRGVRNILVEARTLGSGNTGNTTAKITAQHGLIYRELCRKIGIEMARAYYMAHTDAIGMYKKLAESYDFDFEKQMAYVYSTDDVDSLYAEASTYERIGIKPHFDRHPPLPMQTMGALGMAGQAQMNPMKLLGALSKELEIYEQTPVRDIQEHTALLDNGKITADYIVLCTHYPLKNIPGLYFMKMYQHRSYVVAYKNAQDLDGGMYIDARENGLSLRNYKDLLLLGGGDHRTGKRGGGWEEVRRFAVSHYPDPQEVAAWSAQDCVSLDGIPYIGRHTKRDGRLLVATGFNKWGMTGTMAAAQLLSELIAVGTSPYQALFSPQRSLWRPQLYLNALSSVGGLIKMGRRCPHLGCALTWNPQEASWDCPCHGSRFAEDGRLLDNPAKRDLHVE
ncbi:MAG: FAD-dependent oxidoreductase [Christensenellales bacterium]